jgi:hypothetical protein
MRPLRVSPSASAFVVATGGKAGTIGARDRIMLKTAVRVVSNGIRSPIDNDA